DLRRAIDGLDGDFPHTEIAGDGVIRDAAVNGGDGKIVEERIFGRPQIGAGNGDIDFTLRNAGGTADGDTVAENGGVDGDTAGGVRVEGEAELGVVHIRHEVEATDAGGVHGFEPRRLPNAAGGGVHDAAGIECLFAARLAAGIFRTVNLDDEFVG